MNPKFNKRRFVLRLIVLPIVVILLAVTFGYQYIKSLFLRSFNFMMYGGEFVLFGEDLHRDSIDELLKGLHKQNSEKVTFGNFKTKNHG